MRFKFSNKSELKWEGHGSNPISQIIFNLKENKKLSKGYLYNLARVNDLEHEVPSLDFVPIVSDFKYVFQEDLPSFPLQREIDFGVDLDLNQFQFLHIEWL